MELEIEALSGLRVLELADPFSASSLCGRLLADLGADVVMLEPPTRSESRSGGIRPDSDQSGSLFEFVGSGKRSVLINTSDSVSAIKMLTESIAGADVLLVDQEGFELLCDYGITQESLKWEVPHLIFCCLTPFGLTGPLAGVPATEITLQAIAGPMLANGYPEDPPVKAGIPVARCGGAILSALAIMAAVYERHISGLGQFIDIGQFDVLMTMQGTLLPSYFITGKPFVRIGNRHGMAAPWNAYRSSDRWIVLCTMGQSQWKALTTLIGHPQLMDDERFSDAELRVRNTVELDEFIESWTRSRSSEEAVAALDAVGIPVGPILDLDEVLSDPHTLFRELVVKREGDVVPGSIIKVGLAKAKVPPPSPVLGESSVAWESGSRSDWFSSGTRHSVAESIAVGVQPKGPLHGVRILEIGSFTAGPLAGRLLSMLGAEVVKIEPPQGEGSRRLAQRIGETGYLYFLNNTDKYGCTLDLGSADGRQKFLDLAKSSDVLITNLSSDLMNRYHLNHLDLADVSSQLIYCAITGYGLFGPNGGRKAFDTVVQATSGIMTLTGFPDEPPLKVAMSVADVMGACLGAAGVTAALLKRLRTGRGELVDASMHDVAVWATQEVWPVFMSGTELPSHRGNKDYRCCPNACYLASDRHVVISVENDSQWQVLLRLVDRPELSGDSRFETSEARLANCDEVDEIVKAWVANITGEEIVRLCWEVGVPAAVPAELGEAVNAEQTQIRKMILTQNHSEYGPIFAIGSPFKFSRTPADVQRIAPKLGEHNEKYLHE